MISFTGLMTLMHCIYMGTIHIITTEIFFYTNGSVSSSIELLLELGFGYYLFIPLTIWIIGNKNKKLRNLYIVFINIAMSTIFASAVLGILISTDLLQRYSVFINPIIIIYALVEFLLKGKTPGKFITGVYIESENKMSLFDHIYRNYMKALGILLWPVSIFYYIKKKEMPWDNMTGYKIVAKNDNLDSKKMLLKRVFASSIDYILIILIVNLVESRTRTPLSELE